MWDSIMQILARFNIDSGVVGAYDSAIAFLSSFSLIVSAISFFLKKKDIFDVDDMVNSILFGKKKRPIKTAEIMFTVDLLLFVVNIVKLFTTIPEDLYVALLILTIVAFVATVFSALLKILLMLFSILVMFAELFRFEFITVLGCLIMVVFIVLSTGVDLFRAIMNFDEILSIIRALP